jgi:serine/threonine-protein kinase RsbW
VTEGAVSAGFNPAAEAGLRDVVEIRLPAQGAFLSVLRTATAGLAARLDFNLDEIEDLRIAVDEACAMLIPDAVPGSDLTCAFELSADAMMVTVTVATTTGRLPERGTFAWTVLSALAGDVAAEVDGDSRVSITLHKRRSGEAA